VSYQEILTNQVHELLDLAMRRGEHPRSCLCCRDVVTDIVEPCDCAYDLCPGTCYILGWRKAP
jgi:hypothetical protein